MKQLTGYTELSNSIFNAAQQDFEHLALEIFLIQYEHNEFYKKYCDAIHVKPADVRCIQQIPFIPVQFFKSNKVVTTDFEPAVIFESSGTTGSVNSQHFIKDLSLYEKSFLNAFNMFYGDPAAYSIIGLLPSYLERKNSSLVWMVNDLIQKSGHPRSGFYLYDHEKLKQALLENENNEQPTLLIGVTYALLDFFEVNPVKLHHTIIMETGGMKGRREEMTRANVHRQLMAQTDVISVHSEYGMTELLSQAYSKQDGLFRCPPWMKILLRAEDDPFEIQSPNKIKSEFANGVINIIDLANLYSCAFIATDDIGRLYKDGSFEVLGRLDNSDVRGCSLMY